MLVCSNALHKDITALDKKEWLLTAYFVKLQRQKNYLFRLSLCKWNCQFMCRKAINYHRRQTKQTNTYF